MSIERDLLNKAIEMIKIVPIMASIGNVPPDFASELILEIQQLLSQPEHDGYMDGKAFKDRHITLRDHFAGMAMQGFLAADYNDWDYEKLALTSYEQADAMIAEREKRDD